ncbi:Na+/H+ antiporter subunit D [Novibacillus thermophilus]|uniref:Na+/H+ antiporter subunit D n=1 Tax=Novibacillus thermophilus TaxID=1471761 RepID=A0A1U9K608_9BACL|nr:Na+/H+ antiporter subunit D [Novibacillus thermophilus]AQS55453.1 Na+/H+ antiporter subunit D [Novibacillus thermophilus]
MNNVIVFPVIVPLLTGILLIFLKERVGVQRVLSAAGLFLSTGIALFLVRQVPAEGIQTLAAGNWPAPFGIVFVADMFAVLLILTTHLVGLACLFFSFRGIGEGRERHYYYPLFLFLVGGVCGAFLTGDAFNLFVFFEVLLIASYALIALGGTRRQLRESLKYVVVNVVSSTLFLISLGFLYAVTGTLNMADLSVKVADSGQPGVLTALSVLFLVVFAIKAALFPLYFWLPDSYAAPPTPVAALFAGLLTKVGVYAIFRFFTLIFVNDTPFTHTMILIFAAVTMVIGVIGAVGSENVKHILAYNVISAVGLILTGLGFYNDAGVTGAVLYLVHDMIIKACLFLLGGVIVGIAGTEKLAHMGGLIKKHPQLGWLFFTAAMSLAGIPPLSGFVGKVLLLQGGIQASSYWVVGLSLLVSLLILFSVMRIFIYGVWGEERFPAGKKMRGDGALLAPAAFLVVLSVAIGLGAEGVYPYISLAGEQLMDPSLYIESVNVKE